MPLPITFPIPEGYGLLSVQRVLTWHTGRKPLLENVQPASDGSYQLERSTVVCWRVRAANGRSPARALWGRVEDFGQLQTFLNEGAARRAFRSPPLRHGGSAQQVTMPPLPRPAEGGPRVIEIPSEVIEHVQGLTEANENLAQALFAARTALVAEGHAHECEMVLGTGKCSCPASQGPGLMGPEEMAIRFGRMRTQYERALSREQAIRHIMRIPDDEDTVAFCRGLIESVLQMYQVAHDAVEQGDVQAAQSDATQTGGGADA
jgi:hypothetical protein